jgi:PEP-CTERM motif
MRARRRVVVIVLGLAATALLGWAGPAAAGPITIFTNIDPGAGPLDLRPNSNAAAAAFDAASGAVNPITFETYPLGAFASLTQTPGVTLNASPANGARITTGGNSTSGYNTTPLGSNFLRFDSSGSPVSVTFTFAKPVDAFGAYFTGVRPTTPELEITFNDGTTHEFLIPGVRNGGVLFWGFTDPGASIESITVTATNPDVIGMDDVRFVSTPPPTVPEPSSLALLSLGLGLAGWRRWKKRATA